jgi:hypothetical protein
MLRNLSDDELAGIEGRADLCFRLGDREALRAEDVADLITEVRELHQLRAHLIAMHRQAAERLGQLGERVPAEALDMPPWVDAP